MLQSAYTKNRETKGTDTISQSWIDRYAELAPGFADDLARIEQEYRAARQEVIAEYKWLAFEQATFLRRKYPCVAGSIVS